MSRQDLAILSQDTNHYTFAWYRDRTANQVFSVKQYPLSDKGNRGVNLCTAHGNRLMAGGYVDYDATANTFDSPTECWICRRG